MAFLRKQLNHYHFMAKALLYIKGNYSFKNQVFSPIGFIDAVTGCKKVCQSLLLTHSSVKYISANETTVGDLHSDSISQLPKPKYLFAYYSHK